MFFLIKKNKKENSIISYWKWIIMFKYKKVNKHLLMLPHNYWKKYMFKVVLVGHVKLWSLYSLEHILDMPSETINFVPHQVSLLHNWLS